MYRPSDPNTSNELARALAERDAAVAALETAEAANVRQLRMLMEEQDRFVERMVAQHEQELLEARNSVPKELTALRRELALLIDERQAMLERIAHCESELALAKTLLDSAIDGEASASTRYEDPPEPEPVTKRDLRSGFVAKKSPQPRGERISERPTVPPETGLHDAPRRTASGGKPVVGKPPR